MPAIPPPPPDRKGKPKRSQAYMQALAIEQILAKTINDPATPAQSRASCAVAWTRVQETKRIMRGKPLPGNLRPELEHKARKPKARLLPLPSDAIPLDQCPQDPPVSSEPAGPAAQQA